MKKLILKATPLAQWHALVEEACTTSSISLSEDLSSYLVFLLMRFANEPDVVKSILASDFLTNIKKSRSESLQILRDVGDKCLLFAGFFPKLAERRRVQVSYYVELGQSAYASLSEGHKNQWSLLFSKLGQHFVGLMDVLHSMRELDTNFETLDAISAEELWQKTQSRYALAILKKTSDGYLIPRDNSNPLQKH